MSSKEESIRVAINRILGGQKFDPRDDDNLDLQERKLNEKVVFTLEDRLCREFFSFFIAETRNMEAELQRRSEALNDESTIGESKKIEEDLYKAKRRVQVLSDIFWGMVKELNQGFDIYQYPSLGLRAGWQIVVPAPRGPSIFDLFNLGPLGPGFNPDPEDNDF